MKLSGISHLALSLSLLPSMAAASSSQSSVPIIDLGYAKYAGYTNETAGINYYRGLRYASPPTGRLRWEKPNPIEADPSYTGQTIQATSLAPSCYQGIPEWETAELRTYADQPQGQSEDCLILDVLVPSEPSSKNLPVVIQIHGGGYTTGSAQTAPGDAVVHASNGGLIYVSIQYRLGLFGFLAGSEIQEKGVQNAGLYDQRAAIEWVQRHITAFGGDPSKITIWGASAGGGSVTYQLMAAGGFGVPPFRAAIAEYPWWQPLLNSSTQEIQYNSALQASGCDDVNCLRRLSSEDLAAVGQVDLNSSYPGTGNGYGTFWFGPVVDGEFIQDLPDVAFKKGNYYDVPLLVDRDGYEGLIFSNASQTTQTEETLDVSSMKMSSIRIRIEADQLVMDRPNCSSQMRALHSSADFISSIHNRHIIRPCSNDRVGSATLSSIVRISFLKKSHYSLILAKLTCIHCRSNVRSRDLGRRPQLKLLRRVQTRLRCRNTSPWRHCSIYQQ